VRTGSVIAFVLTATTSSAGVLATLLLQQQRGLTPLQAAFLLLPFSIAVIAGSVLSRRLARTPFRRLAGIGLAGIAAGNLVLALTAGAVAGVVAGVVVAGIGLGLASVASTAIGTDVAEDLVGSATGLLNTAAQLGTALGVSVLITVAAIGGPMAGTVLAWTIAAVAAALLSAVMLVHREGAGSAVTSVAERVRR
jgi:MFS family permease